MKVFISWSGELSKQVALVLKDWIPDVLQGVETWISTDDIEKGSLWFGDISKQLADTGIGILCLTRENISAPWVLFEAGALSKGLSANRVCPLLVNLNHSDLKPPLSQFNGTLPKKDDMLRLIQTINAQGREKALSPERVQKSFDQWWREFESKFSKVLAGYKPAKEVHRRPAEEMIEEILEIARSLQKASQQEFLRAPYFPFPMPTAITPEDAARSLLTPDRMLKLGDDASLSRIRAAAIQAMERERKQQESLEQDIQLPTAGDATTT